MRIVVDKEQKLIQIWVMPEEEPFRLESSPYLKNQIAEYHKKKYGCAVFHSGTADLITVTQQLLRANAQG